MNAQRRHEELLTDAVRVLTEAARHVVTWRDGDGREHHDRVDFAEFVTHAVTGAAANIGGVEEILARRPGSWEADHVRQLLQSTVGYYEEYLIEHRTEPLTVVVAVDNLLSELGFRDLFDEAHLELDRREEQILVDSDEPFVVIEELPDEQQAAFAELRQLRDALDALRKRDWADYGQAFEANVLAAASELLPGLLVPVEVEVHLDWQADDTSDESPCGPAYRLWERAFERTPLPGSGMSLNDYPLDADIAQIERDAGRDPLSRLRRGEGHQ
jgi:hypothetical protein